jgi:hypothetical protein
MDLSGFLAGVKRPDLQQHVVATATLCLMQATQEWITRSTSPSLKDRFGPGAHMLNSFTRRSPDYEKQQRRKLGSAQPYRSPRGDNFAALAQRLMKGDILGATKALQRIHVTPMYRVIFQRGRGWNIRPRPTSTSAGVSVSWPGARNLNRGGAKNHIYAQEFRDLNRGGAGRWILMRTAELLDQKLWKPMGKTTKRIAVAA